MSSEMNNDNNDWEEEDTVVIELNGILENDWMNKIGAKCKIVGIDQEHPVLQLGHYIFTGDYKDTIGSLVLFEKEPQDLSQENSSDDGIEDGKTHDRYKFRCHTHKKLYMQRAFLTEKESTSVPSAEPSGTDAEAASTPCSQTSDTIVLNDPSSEEIPENMETDSTEPSTSGVT